MIDLDTMAERRAAQVKEDAAPWCKGVWHPVFQRISANMTDGEIDEFLNLCPTHKHFEALLEYMEPKKDIEHPLIWMNAAAASKRLELNEWIQSLVLK